MLPNFICVGAGKTGTSWLHECFSEHPDVCVPSTKEVNYFSHEYDRGPSWYEKHFEWQGEQAIGEFCPSYMVTPGVPKRIFELLPDVRLLFVFRDPIARAYSHYCMHLRAGAASEKPDEEIVEGTRLFEEGRYYSHLSRFLKVFDRERILVLVYDDLKQDPGGFLRRVSEFLNVEGAFQPSILNQTFHGRKPRPKYQSPYNLAVSVARHSARRSRLARRLVSWIRKGRFPDWFHRLNRGARFPRLSPDAEHRLAQTYRGEIEALSTFLGRELTWLDKYS